jgi:hypothetical protein
LNLCLSSAITEGLPTPPLCSGAPTLTFPASFSKPTGKIKRSLYRSSAGLETFPVCQNAHWRDDFVSKVLGEIDVLFQTHLKSLRQPPEYAKALIWSNSIISKIIRALALCLYILEIGFFKVMQLQYLALENIISKYLKKKLLWHAVLQNLKYTELFGATYMAAKGFREESRIIPSMITNLDKVCHQHSCSLRIQCVDGSSTHLLLYTI